MTQAICIIGTDTGIGKTYTCCKIMDYLNNYNYRIATLKPVASGQIESEYGLINEDVHQLLKVNNYIADASKINPFCFKSAIAPHIAASQENVDLSIKTIASKLSPVLKELSNLTTILIEGVGGLMVPLNEEETYLDLVKSLKFPVIVVVGLKLGCLNHALLTAKVLALSKVEVIGWISNQIDPTMQSYKENFEFLKAKLSLPLLATISHNEELQPTSQFMEIFRCN